MRWIKYFTAVLIIMIMSGCWTLSLHPLFNEEDAIFDRMLIGKWYEPKSRDQIWMFDQLRDNTYRLVIVDEGVKEHLEKVDEGDFRFLIKVDPTKDGIFEAHLIQLGEYTFLDLFPAYPDAGNEMYISHVIPAHSFARVRIEGHVLLLAFINPEWLQKNIEQGKVSIKHERRDDLIILTADTEELKKFILDHVDEAFDDWGELHRLE